MDNAHSLTWQMFMNVTEFLEGVPYEPSQSVSDWAKELYTLWKTFLPNMTQKEYLYGKAILLGILGQYIWFGKTKGNQGGNEAEKEDGWSMEKRKAIVERIRSAPQIEQRTENWFKESLTILSGSQYATILKQGRTRGQLVLEKAGITKRETGGPTVVMSAQLNPFMWGIRFEPVVKQIYEALTNTKVAELGRLRHATNQRLGASPDGLVVQDRSEEQKRFGRFVEFKAPVTRQIYNKVPDEYRVQMQIQMEVGDVEECDYLEVKFKSVYKNPYSPPQEESPPVYQGNIFIVEEQKNESMRYEYSPLNDMDWKPVLGAEEQLLETIPWYTNEWYLTTVPRERDWYGSVKEKEMEFWRDVKGAKEGTWTLPESTRKPREKVAKYDFIDSESDHAQKKNVQQ